VKRKVIITALILIFILIGLTSYFLGTKFRISSVSNESAKTSVTPTVTFIPTVTATPSSQTSPTVTITSTPTPQPTITNTPTPTKTFLIPILRKVVTSTPTPTPSFQIPNIRTK